MKTMKGFYFLVSILLIVMLHLVTISVWANSEAMKIDECKESDNANIVSSDFTSGCSKNGMGHDNPADFYCVELGYEIEVFETDYGQQGICLFPDGSSCDTWEFLEGKCGESFSYCAQQDYDQITKDDGQDPYSQEYAVCVDKQTGEEIGSITELLGLLKLFERSIFYEPYPGPALYRTKSSSSDGTEYTSRALGSLPSSFDWRNHDGQNWMTSVKNQSSCGSCWAFSAVGTVEAVYNIATNNTSLDLDLSEEYLNSDASSGSCCGGSHTSALNYIKINGIPDEDCLPYDVGYYISGNCSCYPNPPCKSTCSGLPGSCSHLNQADECVDAASRLVPIADYGSVPEDRDQIKDKLVEKGPLSVCLAMKGTYDAQNVYRCTTCWDRDHDSVCDTVGVCDPNGVCSSGMVGEKCSSDSNCDEDKNNDGVCNQEDCGTNHCVVIVGYNDGGGGYWIAKNSWGTTFSSDGYWEVGYGECNIEKYVYYAEAADIDFPPIADADGPYVTECQGVTTEVSLDGTGSSDPDGGTLTYSWSTNCAGGSYDNSTSPAPILSVDTSPGCSVACNATLTVTDDDLGSNDTDTSAVVITDSMSPNIVCPTDIIIECDEPTDPANTGNASATEVCNPGPSVTFSDALTPGTCPQEFTIIRTWTATDVCGNSSNCNQAIEVVDTTAPEIICPPDLIVEQTSADGTPVDLGNPTVSDNCDVNPDVMNDAPAVFPLGETIVIWTSADACNNSSSCTQSVTVVDTTPPEIHSVSASPNSPWPPNHKMVPVTVTCVCEDICDIAPVCRIVSIESNQPVNDQGDGNTDPDWEITGDLTADLRSESSGSIKGDRIYTITIECTDFSGNSSDATIDVIVKHDQGTNSTQSNNGKSNKPVTSSNSRLMLKSTNCFIFNPYTIWNTSFQTVTPIRQQQVFPNYNMRSGNFLNNHWEMNMNYYNNPYRNPIFGFSFKSPSSFLPHGGFNTYYNK